MALYVKFKKPRTIKEFLIEFYKNTDYGCGTAGVTYFDVECTKIHCSKSYRSFDDLLELVQTYYPSTTPKRMIYHLITLKILNPKTNRMFVPHLGVCAGMGRIRYIPYPDWNCSSYLTKQMGQSKYTWKELLSLLNIKDIRELKEFVKNN